VRPKLAISLNGSNDTLRSEVMPAEPEVEPGGPDEGGTGVSAADAREDDVRVCADRGCDRCPGARARGVELVRGMRARINLIALNPGTELPYRTPEEDRVRVPKNIGAAGIPGIRAASARRDNYLPPADS